MKNNLIYLKLQ